MKREIVQRQFPCELPSATRVAAYARVSSGKDAMLHSLASQVDYYKTYISNHPGWSFAGVYIDESKSGTRDSRDQFQCLLADCRAGKIDHIITKSISRFARNTVTLLSAVRELKALQISVFFEEQNIDTLTADGELILTLLASFAQAESLSVSENMKWRIRNNFKEGIPWDKTLIGYRFKDGQYVIEPSEAETVKFIFSHYLDGQGIETIAKALNRLNMPTRFGNKWHAKRVMAVLTNYTYTGNLILQKTYCADHLTKKMLANTGQLPKFHVTESHEAIIDIDTFNEVQKLVEKRSAYFSDNSIRNTHPLSGKIVCGICGKNYRYKKRREKRTWICTTYNNKGKGACPSKQVPEEIINDIVEQYGLANIHKITVKPDNELLLSLIDGSTYSRHWNDRSRRESWTPEMKAKAAEDGRRRKCKQHEMSQ